MKKIIALLLTFVLAFSVVACSKGGDATENKTTDKTTETTASSDDSTDEGNEPATEEDPAVDGTEENNEPAVEETPAVDGTEGFSVAESLAIEFNNLVADTSLDAQAIADSLIGADVLAPVAMATMPIEDVYLSGFDNYEVKGFSECVMFAPMIGGAIAFVGYVFTVGDGVDAQAFADDLMNNANLRWNICVTADDMITEVEGNKVLFVMAPTSFETENSDDDVVDMDYLDEIPAYDGEMAE